MKRIRNNLVFLLKLFSFILNIFLSVNIESFRCLLHFVHQHQQGRTSLQKIFDISSCIYMMLFTRYCSAAEPAAACSTGKYLYLMWHGFIYFLIPDSYFYVTTSKIFMKLLPENLAPGINEIKNDDVGVETEIFVYYIIISDSIVFYQPQR